MFTILMALIALSPADQYLKTQSANVLKFSFIYLAQPLRQEHMFYMTECCCLCHHLWSHHLLVLSSSGLMHFPSGHELSKDVDNNPAAPGHVPFSRMSSTGIYVISSCCLSPHNIVHLFTCHLELFPVTIQHSPFAYM